MFVCFFCAVFKFSIYSVQMCGHKEFKSDYTIIFWTQILVQNSGITLGQKKAILLKVFQWFLLNGVKIKG